jgi:hypothetical protein
MYSTTDLRVSPGKIKVNGITGIGFAKLAKEHAIIKDLAFGSKNVRIGPNDSSITSPEGYIHELVIGQEACKKLLGSQFLVTRIADDAVGVRIHSGFSLLTQLVLSVLSFLPCSCGKSLHYARKMIEI